MKWLKVGWICLLLLLTGCTSVENNTSKEQLKISFINIGKGDAFLIDIPNEGYYLCDTGKRQDFAKIARFLKMKHVDELEGIFLSHGHLDHAGNVETIIDLIPTKKVYLSKKDVVSYRKSKVQDIVTKKGIDLIYLNGGENLKFKDTSIQIWIPSHVDKVNENNNSMVMKINYGDTSFLMCGDMEKEEEANFLFENKNIKSDVLKLGHHGEKDATSIALLEKVKPQYGIITGNKKENPESVNKTIKSRLDAYGISAFYSEGEQIAIDFISNKKDISLEYIYDKEIESNIKINGYDVNKQTITLSNESNQNINVSNYLIRSKKGEEWFQIPLNTTIPAKTKLVICCQNNSKPTDGCMIWKQDHVWDNDDKEEAVLYDQEFHKLDEFKGEE